MDEIGVGDVVAIAALELGLEHKEVIARAQRALDGAPGDVDDEDELAYAVWRFLMSEKPEAFLGRSTYSTGIGFAYRYARRRQPHQLASLALSHSERLLLRTTRDTLARWSGLPRWSGFRHVVFAPDCVPLAATVAARGRYGGGFALTHHPGLEHTALYPVGRIIEYRANSSESLVSVLLHEEFHLATALASATDDYEAVGVALFEAAAQIAQHTACLIASGYIASRAELLDYLDENGDQDLCQVIAVIAEDAVAVDREVVELIRRAARLAVIAGAGDEPLRRALGGERFARVAELLDAVTR